MHRPTVGLLAIALLGSGIALLIWPQPWDFYQPLLAACWRVGSVMAALWLAHPQVSQLPSWFVATLLITGLVVALRPKLIVVAVPMLLAVWAMRPRGK